MIRGLFNLFRGEASSVIPPQSPSFSHFLYFLSMVVVCPVALAEAGPEAQALAALTTFNRVGLAEHAGSHGSLGLSLGAGASRHSLSAMGEADRQAWGFAEPGEADGKPTDGWVIPRLWLVKGLPIPVDVGITVGMSQAPIMQQGTGYVQWTVFEGFGMPALSMRLAESRLFAPHETTLVSHQTSVAASWDFLRYVSLFGSASWVLHEGTTHLSTLGIGQPGGLGATGSAGTQPVGSTGSTTVRESWDEYSSSLGLRVMVIPPFVSVTGEMIRVGGALDTALAKLAVTL